MNVGSLVRRRWLARRDRPALVSSDGALSYRDLLAAIESGSRDLGSVVSDASVVVGGGHSSLFDFAVAYFSALITPGVAFDVAPSGTDWTAEFVEGRWRSRGPAPIIETGADDLVIVPTSGTTGRPKRVVHSFERLLWAVWNSSTLPDELAGNVPPPPDDLGGFVQDMSPTGQVFMTGMPSGTIASLTALNRSLVVGDVLAVPRSFDPADLVAAIVGGRVTSLGLPPFTAQSLLRCGQRPEGHALLQCGLGGAGTAATVFEQLEAWLGVPVLSAYGTTEIGGPALMGRPWDPPSVRWHTAGRPIGAVQARVIEDGAHDGRLELHSPSSMIGILAADLSISPAPAWLATGDLAQRIDATGPIRIIGRHDFVIQRGGRQIDPAHIEAILDTCPSVARSGVSSVPSRVAGEHDIVALVTSVPGHGVADVRSFCVARLPPHQVPRRIHEVDEIPLARDGSPDRRRLDARIAEVEL